MTRNNDLMFHSRLIKRSQYQTFLPEKRRKAPAFRHGDIRRSLYEAPIIKCASIPES